MCSFRCCVGGGGRGDQVLVVLILVLGEGWERGAKGWGGILKAMHGLGRGHVHGQKGPRAQAEEPYAWEEEQCAWVQGPSCHVHT